MPSGVLFFRGRPALVLPGSSQKYISAPTRFIWMLFPDAFTADPRRRRTVAKVSPSEGVSLPAPSGRSCFYVLDVLSDGNGTASFG